MPDLKFTPVTSQQIEAMEDESENLLLWGPGGSGKTEIGVIKPIVVGIAHPRNRIALIRRVKTDLRLTLWQRFMEALPQEIITRYDDNRMFCEIEGGTEYYGLGMNEPKDITKLASAEFGMAVIEESTEIPELFFDEKIKRSIRLPRVKFHQTLSLCNPDIPLHWINKRWILEKWKGYKCIYMPTIPESAGILPHSWYEWLNSLTGVFAQRYREGKWVAVEGIVYPYDPQKHNISRSEFRMSSEGRIIRDVDFGYEHPFVCQWWYISPEDIWYRFREIYMTHRRVEEHAKDMIRLSERDFDPNPLTICDHDAENMADLKEAGINVMPANKERLAGQQSVQKLFEENRIFFVEDSLVELDIRRQMKKLPTKTEEEFPLYVWANKTTKEDMVKQFDDGMDGMRYGIHTIGEKGSYRIRKEDFLTEESKMISAGIGVDKKNWRDEWE